MEKGQACQYSQTFRAGKRNISVGQVPGPALNHWGRTTLGRITTVRGAELTTAAEEKSSREDKVAVVREYGRGGPDLRFVGVVTTELLDAEEDPPGALG